MIVIDTHVLLWWLAGEARQLSPAAQNAIEAELDGGTIFVSSASAWEIAILASRRRIGLASDVSEWLKKVGEIEAVKFVPIDNEIAVKSTQLGEDFHKDPADRWIVATSQKLGAPLVTADSKITQYPHVATIW
ncbi:type II toxin-antitoxin system VapC family toxin [Mesorhizobium sp. YR577]|uniref:type II toxin-antitoxin system VapC family toxin n=1 Tax=Mesorhizobium sp. YR577 TaxID=1884373 RepID=UPI0008E45F39|nr:type II toxin-antitoxin system VapC family toxin [Mesorhizobium sp. YR577]SFT48032.1 PIN domain nuclease, a component of toxin-antitoxin system (PIN domain) [Mesorhizobium sp. YR577]